MSMAQPTDVCHSDLLHQEFAQLQDVVRQAAREGKAIHNVELDLWRRVLTRLRQELEGLLE